MKITVEHHFADYRGDHSTGAVVAHEPGAHETVEGLAKQLLGSRSGSYHDGTDFIVIRKVHPPEPPKPV